MHHEEVVESGDGEGADDFSVHDGNRHAAVVPEVHLHRVQENRGELENLKREEALKSSRCKASR